MAPLNLLRKVLVELPTGEGKLMVPGTDGMLLSTLWVPVGRAGQEGKLVSLLNGE